jgi:hypothetical protein
MRTPASAVTCAVDRQSLDHVFLDQARNIQPCLVWHLAFKYRRSLLIPCAHRGYEKHNHAGDVS